MPDVNWTVIASELVIAASALLVLAMDIFAPRNRGVASAWVTLAGTCLALAVAYQQWGNWGYGFNAMVILDKYATFFNVIFLIGTGLTVFISTGYLRREGVGRGEYYFLILCATLGMMLMAAGTDLVVIFLGVELLSLSLYVLVGFTRARAESNESSLKYLLLGAFATGFLLYGIALIYGAAGTTNLQRIGAALAQRRVENPPLLLAGTGMLLVGLGFKVAAVPFHMWVPDVYDGAPTAITAFLSAGPKAAGFAALLRVLVSALDPLRPEWSAALWVLAALTMSVGNLAAISQQSIKRMLAYSSIAHAGYVLVALTAMNDQGVSSALFYLFVYTFMNIGAFAVVILVSRQGEEGLDVRDYAGLASRNPALALAMTVFMLSLAGFPPTAGFLGKFYVFGAAVKAGYVSLAVIGVLNSLVSVYFYLGVVVTMYMKNPAEDAQPVAVGPSAKFATGLAAIATLAIGIAPSWCLDLARETVASVLM